MMSRADRLLLARAAYRRAIALARARSTAASWRRALTAAKNLRRALRDCERAGRGPRAKVPAEQSGARGGPEGSSRVVPLFPPAPPAARGPRRFDCAAAQAETPSRCWRLERWPELAAEWERARALMERSRRLVERARALSLDIAGLNAQRGRAHRSADA